MDKSLQRVIERNNSYLHSYDIIDTKDNLHPNQIYKTDNASERILIEQAMEFRSKTKYNFAQTPEDRVILRKVKTKGKKLNPKHIQDKLLEAMVEANKYIKYNAKLIVT